MKKTNCYLCGSGDAEILFTFKGYDKYLATVFETLPKEDMNWMICNNCAFVYRSPVLEQQEYEKLYDNYDTDIFSGITPDEYFDKIISLPANKSENRQKASWLKDVLKEKNADEALRVLDVGCGGGTLLYILKEMLSIEKMCGVELNQVYANLAQKRVEADIRCQSYESAIFGHQFDILINTKVLEHIPDPLSFLREMFKDLKNGGLLFIEVPHLFDMYNFPLNDERFTVPHIYFFSEGTLGALLEKAGFSVITSRVFDASRKRSYLQIIAKKIEGSKAKHILSRPLDDIKFIINKIHNKL